MLEILNRLVKNKKIVIYSLLSVGVVSSVGNLVFPHFFAAEGESINANQVVVMGVIIVGVIITEIILFTLLYSEIRKELFGTKEVKKLARVFPFVALLLVIGIIMLLINLIYSVIAMLVWELLKTQISIDQMKNLVDVMRPILSILMIPVLISALMVFGLRGKRVLESIKASFKETKKMYTQLLITIGVLYVSGRALMYLLSYTGEAMVADVLRTIVYTVGATVAHLIIASVYTKQSKLEIIGEIGEEDNEEAAV